MVVGQSLHNENYPQPILYTTNCQTTRQFYQATRLRFGSAVMKNESEFYEQR